MQDLHGGTAPVSVLRGVDARRSPDAEKGFQGPAVADLLPDAPLREGPLARPGVILGAWFGRVHPRIRVNFARANSGLPLMNDSTRPETKAPRRQQGSGEDALGLVVIWCASA